LARPIHRAGKIDPLRAKYGITADAAIEKLRPVLAASQKSADGVGDSAVHTAQAH
jgi:hypothetical protein